MNWPVVGLALFVPVAALAQTSECRLDQAVFLGGDRPVSVTVEIADDPGERAQGLMFRHDLADGHGMLFVYEHPQPVSFWMRNTPIALDMIFIDARGEVRHVHPMAHPFDERAIPGAAVGDPEPDRALVLEVGGGEAARMGIHPGMMLAHPRVPQAEAAAPCN